MAETNPDKLQKFVIKPDGTVFVEWVNPAFSDVILELYPEDEKKKFLKLNEGRQAKIWCG
jgi:hypothetical protein